VIINGGAFTFSHRDEIVALAARYELPASYGVREFATAGGLISSTQQALQMPIAKSVCTRGGFSRARSRAICRSYSPPNSSS
jgi:hypothetical protein